VTLSVELTWALAASALLMAEQARHRRALNQEVRALRNTHDVVFQRNEQLTQAMDEMGRLYRNQLLTSRKQAARLKKVLEIATSINSDLALDKVLHEIVHAVSDAVGFRIVLLRVLDERTGAFDARSFAGLSRDAIEKLEQYDVPREEFESWLRDEFRISRSYFISHKAKFWSKDDSSGYTPDLGVRKEGEWHQDDVLFVPLYTKDGSLLGYLSVDDPIDRRIPTRDVVETIEILAAHAVVALQNASLYERLGASMRQLESATERAEELNRLKSSFMSIVSHELRTPLTMIRAYVEPLLENEGSSNTEMQRDFLKVIDEQSSKLKQLIESILELSQLESERLRMHREPLNIVDLIDDVIGALRPMADAKGITLHSEPATPELIAEADPGPPAPGSVHLGNNAVKFTRGEGGSRSGRSPRPGWRGSSSRTPGSASLKRRSRRSSTSSIRATAHSPASTRAWASVFRWRRASWSGTAGRSKPRASPVVAPASPSSSR
jgi:signal transduction histidine kinase